MKYNPFKLPLVIISIFLLGFFSTNVWGSTNVLFDQGHRQAFLIENSEELDLSKFAEVFRNEGIEVSSSNSPLIDSDLSNVDAIVISGAFTPLSPQEIITVREYIKRGGKVVLMLHIAHPHAKFITELGLMHSNGVIREQQNNIKDSEIDFSAATTGNHFITADLKNFNLYGAWALGAIDPKVEIIASTSPSAWVDLNRDGHLNKGDAMQSLGVAAAGTLGSGAFIVFGDDAIFQNRFLINENKKLASNLAKWISNK